MPSDFSINLFKRIRSLVEISLIFSVALLPFSKAAAEILTSMMICWAPVYFFKTGSLGWRLPGWLITLFLLFFAVILLSLTQIPPSEMKLGIRGVIRWLQYLGIFFWTAAIVRGNPAVTERIIKVFLVSMIFVSLNGFYQLGTGQDLLRQFALEPGRVTRMTSTLQYPNNLACFLYFAIAVCFFVLARLKTLTAKILPAAASVLFITAFFLTFSRGAFLAFLISLLVFATAYTPLRLPGLFLLLVSAVTILFVPVLQQNFIQSMRVSDITIQERLDYWQVAWGMVQNHPFLGVGINRYHAVMQELVAGTSLKTAYTHNSYLQLASEIGIPGILIFLIVLGLIFWKGLLRVYSFRSKALPAVAAGVPALAFTIQSLADTHFIAFQPAVLFWIFFGIFTSETFPQKD